MIWYYLLTGLAFFINFLFGFLPEVTVLPLGLDDAIGSAMGYFNGFLEIFPPFAVILGAFLWYLAFEVVLLTLRIFKIVV